MIHVPFLHQSNCSGPPDVAGVGAVEGAGNGDGLWADHGDKVWCGTCLGRLSPGLPGRRRAKMMHMAFREIPLRVCVCMCDVRVILVWGKLNINCGWVAVL